MSKEELFLEDRGDRWSFVNVLPDSGFIQTSHHGKRTSEEADSLVAAIQANSDGEAPLFLSDGWSGYEDIPKNTTVLGSKFLIPDEDDRAILFKSLIPT